MIRSQTKSVEPDMPLIPPSEYGCPLPPSLPPSFTPSLPHSLCLSLCETIVSIKVEKASGQAQFYTKNPLTIVNGCAIMQLYICTCASRLMRISTQASVTYLPPSEKWKNSRLNSRRNGICRDQAIRQTISHTRIKE